MRLPGRSSEERISEPRATDREPTNLGQNESDLTDEKSLARIWRELQRLDGISRAMNAAYSERLMAAESVIGELKARVAALERRTIGGEPEDFSPSTVLHDEYREIARNAETLLDQYVTQLAELTVAEQSRRDRPPTGTVAKRAAAICEALFSGPDVDPAHVQNLVGGMTSTQDPRVAQLLEIVMRRIQSLRQDARSKGLPHVWSFSGEQEGPLNSVTRKPFGSCDPRGAVAFVVFPALLVDGEVFLRQVVYTT